MTINVKSGSLPLVRPDESRIEAKLLENRRRHYSVEALSNGDEHVVNIVAPPPGDWYVIAYRSWFDPDSGKIQQQGNYCTLFITIRYGYFYNKHFTSTALNDFVLILVDIIRGSYCL